MSSLGRLTRESAFSGLTLEETDATSKISNLRQRFFVGIPQQEAIAALEEYLKNPSDKLGQASGLAAQKAAQATKKLEALEASETTPKSHRSALGAGSSASPSSDSVRSSSTLWHDPSGKVFQIQEIDGKRFCFMANTIPDSGHNVIPIAIEMYFYTQRLVQAMLENFDDYPSLTAQIFEAFMIRFSEEFKGLERLSIAEKNEVLDGKRKEFVKFIQENLASTVGTLELPANPRLDWARYIQEHTAGPITLVQENPNGGITVIEMCEQSSHSKKHAAPAIAPIKIYNDSDKHQCTHFRCPSLVDSDKGKVVDQIRMLIQKHESLPSSSKLAGSTLAGSTLAGSTLTGSTLTEPTAMIYNLLTSFPSPIDLGKEKKTAHHIFESAHQYNREKPVDAPRFLPLNIPVNQQFESLSFSNPNTSEALLLSHLAIANSTLKEVSRRLSRNLAYSSTATEIGAAIDRMNHSYREFLSLPLAPLSDSGQGAEIIRYAAQLRDQVPTLIQPSRTESTQESLKEDLQSALLKLFYSNYVPRRTGSSSSECSEDQRIYGSTIQALHLATSTGNVVGCKSANDRFGFVWNIAEALKNPSEALREAITAFLRSPDPKAAHEFLHQIYIHSNFYNCYGAGHLPSMVDVGAPKYRVSQEVDPIRNPTEWLKKLPNVPSSLTHLKSKNAEKIQPHKQDAQSGLVKTFHEIEKLALGKNSTLATAREFSPSMGTSAIAFGATVLGSSPASSTGIRPESPKSPKSSSSEID
jgi:hypothetical protein